jgi:mannose-6-phosphate isomerase-like protein (cupin superfamily)
MRLAFGHRHTRDEEIYVAVAGSGRAVIEGHLLDLQPLSALRIAPGLAHSFEADADGLELLVFRTHNEGDEGEFADAGWPA